MTLGLASREGAAIPLQSIAIRGELVAAHALLRFAQTYRSNADQPLEAVYTFPLPAEGAVIDFRYRCNDRELAGELREREAAFREYDAAVREGHGAALVERERDDVFTASVGNLLPGETVEIEVEVLLPLDFVDGKLRLKIPTLVPPRFVPGCPGGPRTGLGVSAPTDLVPDADRITPAAAASGAPGYQATLDLRVELGFPVRIESPSHEIRISSESRRSRPGSELVSFAAAGVALDRDFVLKLDTKSSAMACAAHGLRCERTGRGPGTFALSLVPDLGGAHAGRRQLDVVFLLDRSGSMDGDSIVQARSALRACLRQLRTGDHFTIVAFNTGIMAFSRELQAFDESSLDAAGRWIETLGAWSGTELGRALDYAIPLVPDGTLVLLTDAQVGDEDLIAARFASDLTRPGRLPRVLSFGIGTNVAGGLLAELARATGGAVEEIHPGESIEEKVLAQFARAVSLRVEELAITIDGIDAEALVPSAMALTDGEPFVLLGRYAKAGRGRVALRGHLGGEPFALDVPLELPARPAGPSLPGALTRVWAARHIAHLERQLIALGNPRRARALARQIVGLSLEHRVLCKDTAFVVVEKRTGARRRPGAPGAAAIPVHAPAGWKMPTTATRVAQRPSVGSDRDGLTLACECEPPDSEPGPLFRRRGTSAGVPDEQWNASLTLPADTVRSLLNVERAQQRFGLWQGPVRCGDSDERAVRSTLWHLLALRRFGRRMSYQSFAEMISRAVFALLDHLDSWKGTDPELIEVVLRIGYDYFPPPFSVDIHHTLTAEEEGFEDGPEYQSWKAEERWYAEQAHSSRFVVPINRAQEEILRLAALHGLPRLDEQASEVLLEDLRRALQRVADRRDWAELAAIVPILAPVDLSSLNLWIRIKEQLQARGL